MRRATGYDYYAEKVICDAEGTICRLRLLTNVPPSDEAMEIWLSATPIPRGRLKLGKHSVSPLALLHRQRGSVSAITGSQRRSARPNGLAGTFFGCSSTCVGCPNEKILKRQKERRRAIRRRRNGRQASSKEPRPQTCHQHRSLPQIGAPRAIISSFAPFIPLRPRLSRSDEEG